MKNEKVRNFFSKLKPNRAVYITAASLLAALAVIISITVAANRSKKHPSDTKRNNPTVTSRVIPKPDIPPKPDTGDETEKTETDTPASTEKPASADTPIELSLPVSGALTGYHNENEQVWSDTMRDYRVHLGIDIATEENAPVYAAADGVVAQVYEDVRMGYCISVKHEGETYTIYRNLAKNPADGIKAGVNVRAGQLIGCVGNSAMVEIAQDPHLHFEMTVDGKNVNPLDYFDGSAIASLNTDNRYES